MFAAALPVAKEYHVPLTAMMHCDHLISCYLLDHSVLIAHTGSGKLVVSSGPEIYGAGVGLKGTKFAGTFAGGE